VTAPASVKGKLREQCAGEAALKTDRQVRRDQDDRHGNDRPTELARALQCRLERSHALLEVAVDILHDDDCVVDHEADREYERQQGQQV